MADKPKLQVYYASVCGSQEIRKKQQKIFDVLDSKKIEYKKVDITLQSCDKDKMRNLANDEKALAPQICRGDTYIGNFDAFEAAVENGELEDFLQL